MDVFVKDDRNTVYDLEVQTTDKRNLGRRSRYYQSMLDIRALEKGKDYKRLKKSFVIFICNYDPFGLSRYVYTFRNHCDEEPTLILDDDAAKIIINTKGTKGEISEELKAVIRYMDSGEVSSEYTKALDEEVESVRSDEKVRPSVMLLSEAYAEREIFGGYKRIVMQIRNNLKSISIADMARIFLVPVDNCRSVVDTIKAHPDWDDEQVAEEIYWDDMV